MFGPIRRREGRGGADHSNSFIKKHLVRRTAQIWVFKPRFLTPKNRGFLDPNYCCDSSLETVQEMTLKGSRLSSALS